MARETIDITIVDRGKTKVFRITEMPATRADKWATRALLALSRCSEPMPPEILQSGMRGIAAFGFRALLSMPFAEVEPLIDEMSECIKHVPNPDEPDCARRLVESDIDDVSTWWKLRDKVFEIHTGFSPAGLLSSFRNSAVTAAFTPNTETFPTKSVS